MSRLLNNNLNLDLTNVVALYDLQNASTTGVTDLSTNENHLTGSVTLGDGFFPNKLILSDTSKYLEGLHNGILDLTSGNIEIYVSISDIASLNTILYTHNQFNIFINNGKIGANVNNIGSVTFGITGSTTLNINEVYKINYEFNQNDYQRILINGVLEVSGTITGNINTYIKELITFASNRSGEYRIAICKSDGSDYTELTNGNTDLFPCFSNDGTKITFSRNVGGNYQIHIMNIDGTGITNISNNAYYDREGRFSPDDTKIVFYSTRDGHEEVYIMNVDGSSQTRLTNTAFKSETPAYNNDGTKIVFSTNRDGNYNIYKMDSNGSNLVQLTTNAGSDVYATFNNAGTKILFASDNYGSTLHYGIFIMDSDGSNKIQVTSPTTYNDYYPTFSSDDTRIMFHSTRDGNTEIYTANVDGTNQINITNNGFSDLPRGDWKNLSSASITGLTNAVPNKINIGVKNVSEVKSNSLKGSIHYLKVSNKVASIDEIFHNTYKKGVRNINKNENALS